MSFTRQRMRNLVITVAVLRFVAPTLAGDRWPQFRGPTGDGHSDATGLPLVWSETENVVWKVPIHDRGWSSPVVEDGRIWLTTAGDDGHEMFAVCVGLASGKLLHDVRVFTNDEIVQEIHALNSYASPTPVVEDGTLYLHFGVYGTACLDATSADILWQRRDIHCDHSRGPGSSPIVCDNLLIFHMDGMDVQYVIALDKHSGKTVWKTNRSIDLAGLDPEIRKAFSTPLVIVAAGRRQLISSGAQGAYAYDPASGEELWRVSAKGFSNVSRPLFGGGLVLLNTGFARAALWAVRPGGHGDVSDSQVAWKVTKAVPLKPSPVLVDDLLFMVDDRGVASCLEVGTGELVWQERLEGSYSASPIYADGRVYFFSEDDAATVIEPGRRFNVLASNRLDAGCMASAAVVDKALIIRTKTHLYRIEK